MKILISAAEPSSDLHGAFLIRALKKLFPEAEFSGIGGSRMIEEGLEAIVDARELRAMGAVEILGRIQKIRSALGAVSELIETELPDIAIVIDSPDFHFRILSQFKRFGVPVVYYIPPKIWVWRLNRLKVLKNFTNRVCTIFPFETALYRDHGVAVNYVGNPTLEELGHRISQAEAKKLLGIDESKFVLALMPGSRPKELAYHFELFLESALQFCAEQSGDWVVVIPIAEQVDHRLLELKLSQWKQRKTDSKIEFRLLNGQAVSCLRAANLGLIKSGTSTLEAALVGCPHVVVYVGHWLSYLIFRLYVRYRGPVGLSNILAVGKEAHPDYFPFEEIIGYKIIPDRLVTALKQVIFGGSRHDQQLEAFAKIEQTLTPKTGDQSASQNVAQIVQEVLIQSQTHASGVHFDQVGGTPSRWLMLLVSNLWSMASMMSRLFRTLRLIQPIRIRPRVISVGNLQAGGAGKTPLVVQIAREAVARSLKVCVLSRGYGGVWEQHGGIIEPHQGGIDAELAGDEPCLIHERVPQIWIGVGKDRYECYKALTRKMGGDFDLVILDDGLQNHRFEKSIEIGAVTSRSRSQTVYRDWDWVGSSCDLLVWTKGIEPPKNWSRHKNRVKIEYRIEKAKVPTRVVLVTGVGDSDFVAETVSAAGYEVIRHFRFADHSVYSEALARRVHQKASELGATVGMTGKDWVKWKEWGLSPTLVFEPELDFVEGRAAWDRVIWEQLSNESASSI